MADGVYQGDEEQPREFTGKLNISGEKSSSNASGKYIFGQRSFVTCSITLFDMATAQSSEHFLAKVMLPTGEKGQRVPTDFGMFDEFGVPFTGEEVETKLELLEEAARLANVEL